jgi:hypothetical protein
MRRDEIVELLTELGRRLAARGIDGEMYVVRGAAIALAFDNRRSTREIDAVFEPKAAIYEVARELADERGLPDGWLNDAGQGFPRRRRPGRTARARGGGGSVSRLRRPGFSSR